MNLNDLEVWQLTFKKKLTDLLLLNSLTYSPCPVLKISWRCSEVLGDISITEAKACRQMGTIGFVKLQDMRRIQKVAERDNK